MTDDSKPKGPVLPPLNDGDIPPVPKKNDNVIDIKENPKDSQKVKRQKQDTQRERNKKKAKRTIERVDAADSVTPLTLDDEIRKKERKKYNDKKLKDALRKAQSRFAKFVTKTLPAKATSRGNQNASIPSHPLLKKLTGVFDRFNNPDVSKNEVGQQLLLQNQLHNKLQKQKTHTPSAPTPKPL